MAKETRWRDYLDKVQEKIHVITPEWEPKLGKGNILIPAPKDIERLIKQTKKGELLTVTIIRERLAKEKDVLLTAKAPMTIYLKKIGLAAEQERAQGIKNLTPYWRVLNDNGTINEKLPGGLEKQTELLLLEGHQTELFGKRKKVPKVVNFENSLLAFR